MLPLVFFPNKAEEPQVVILGRGRVSTKAGGVYIYEKARSLTGAQWAEKQEKFGKREQFRLNSGRHEVAVGVTTFLRGDTLKSHSPNAP